MQDFLKFTYFFIFLQATIKVENLLKMSLEAYREELENVEDFKLLYSFGYNGDGFRAKVFKRDNVIVIASKGTTLYIHGIALGPTGHKDNLMDNLMFSKCRKEDEDCLYKKKVEIDRLGYLSSLELIVKSLKILFKDHSLILTGHSLGGALSSLISSHLNLPSISFSSPGEKYISNVLQIPQRHQQVYHFGLCEDDLYLGTCGSICSLMGYSINTACHQGKAYCVRLEMESDNLSSHRGESLLEVLVSPTKVLLKIECTGF